MKKTKLATVVLTVALWFGTAAVGYTAPPEKGLPTNITADHMQYSADQQKVIFEGNVHVIREDFDMVAEKMTVLLKKNTAQPSKTSDDDDLASDLSAGELHEIIAERNVIFKSKQKEARAQRARYLVEKDRVTLEGGPPKPWIKDYENDRTVTGDVLHHYIGEGRSEGSGGIAITFTTQDKSPEKPKR